LSGSSSSPSPHQIGGKLPFPGREIDGKAINQVRGTNPKIADRLDLTLECIRLRYLGKNSPLAEVLIRYWAFFELFENFKGGTPTSSSCRTSFPTIRLLGRRALELPLQSGIGQGCRFQPEATPLVAESSADEC
jgi:hypothetical protein